MTDTTESWYGIFLQDQIKLPHDIHVLGGFRYDNANSRDNLTDTDTNEDDAVTPCFGLLWQAIPQLSLYGNYLENFGASNGRGFDLTPLPPESAQQWEVGVKTELFDGRLTGSLAWFDLTKTNIAAIHPDPFQAALGVVEAVGEARNRGLELDVSGEVLPGWNLIASYAYTDSEITKDRQPIFNEDFTEVVGFNNGNQGNRFFGVPQHSGSFWTTFEPQESLWRGLTLGAGVFAQSQPEADSANCATPRLCDARAHGALHPYIRAVPDQSATQRRKSTRQAVY